MNVRYLIRRDTPQWTFQVWVAFGFAALLSMVGIWNLPGDGPDRAVVAIGFFFCLSAAFTLAKTLRDNREETVDTSAWILQVWAAFAIAHVPTAWGILRLDAGGWEKAYVLVCWLFLISATFTLAKTIRDNHEARLLERMPEPVTVESVDAAGKA